MPILSDFLGLPHVPTETFMIQFFTLTLFNFGKHILFLYVLCCKEGKAVIFQTLLFFRLTVHVIISRTVFCKTKQNLINWVINRHNALKIPITNEICILVPRLSVVLLCIVSLFVLKLFISKPVRWIYSTSNLYNLKRLKETLSNKPECNFVQNRLHLIIKVKRNIMNIYN